jgi:nucleoid DNA-binding protein
MRPRRPGSELGAAWMALVMSRLRETGRCHIYGFGVFTLAKRKARRIRNPITKEFMWLPETVTVRFSAAGKLKKAAAVVFRRNAQQGPQPGDGATNDHKGVSGHG